MCGSKASRGDTTFMKLADPPDRHRRHPPINCSAAHALLIVCTVIEDTPNSLAKLRTSTPAGLDESGKQDHFAHYGSKIEINAAS
jgi:hypothetical protein